jgi:multiple sugar transport system ATP-binding protein
MRAEIKRLHLALGSTTVYVTHDQEEAITLGDRVVVMKDGIVQQCASALDIYHHPANRFVAGFLGTPPMTFLEGRLVEDGGRPGSTRGRAGSPCRRGRRRRCAHARRRRSRRSCSACGPRRWRHRRRPASPRLARSWR